MAQTYTPLQLDAFKEVGNIGSGNAATSLSILLKRPVELEVSEVEMLPLKKAYQTFHLDDKKFSSVIHPLSGDLMGLFWFALSSDDEQALCAYAIGDLKLDTTGLIKEISNILGGTYLMALSQMLNTTVLLNLPQEKSLNDFLNHPGNEKYLNELTNAQQVLFIRNRLIIEEKPFDCFVSLLLDDPSLQKVLTCLGV